MITVNAQPGTRIIELGFRGAPNPAAEVHVDAQPGPQVNFTCDFDKPLPITSDEWDGVLLNALPNVGWQSVRQLIAEALRIAKPGGKVIAIVPNVEAKARGTFEDANRALFGEPKGTWFGAAMLTELFQTAGFIDVIVETAEGELCVQATRPVRPVQPQANGAFGNLLPASLPVAERILPAAPAKREEVISVSDWLRTSAERAAIFDMRYFDGGNLGGGYAGGTYLDFPAHEVTFRHIMARKPESVLELGCGRGYVVKRLQDAGVRAVGADVSKHCYMTRVASDMKLLDVCGGDWGSEFANPNPCFDLCLSIAFLEHVPEPLLPNVLAEMKRTCKRGLHGIGFWEGDPKTCTDKTKFCLRPKSWWIGLFRRHGLEDHELLEKDALENDPNGFPKDVLEGDGKLKVNVGSHMVASHYGWLNTDIEDLANWMGAYGYRFQRMDVRQGLPFHTGTVDRIRHSHFLEHLTFAEGLSFLRECRRVIRTDGVMRIAVPDAELLISLFKGEGLSDFDEVNNGCASVASQAMKLHSLLWEGHKAIYDGLTLEYMLREAGFVPHKAEFNRTGCEKIKSVLKECPDTLPCLSLYMDAIPLVS